MTLNELLNSIKEATGIKPNCRKMAGSMKGYVQIYLPYDRKNDKLRSFTLEQCKEFKNMLNPIASIIIDNKSFFIPQSFEIRVGLSYTDYNAELPQIYR